MAICSAGQLSPDEFEAIQAHLGRLLLSPQFASAERQSVLLRFIVHNALAGESDALKESVIAASVYRIQNYPPQIHSTVRVDIGRLRQRLREYYEGPGSAEPARIIIPKGTYTPEFEILHSALPPPAKPVTRRRLAWTAGVLATAAGVAGAWRWGRNRVDAPEVAVEAAAGSGGRLSRDAVLLATALERGGVRVRASWSDSERPVAHVLLGAGDEDERRYVAAMFYTGLYEFPTRTSIFELRDSAELAARSTALSDAIEEAGRDTSGLHWASRTPARERSIETCRNIWRQRVGSPDYTLQHDDPPLALPKLLEMVAQLERIVAADPEFACTHAELAWLYRQAAEHDAKLFEKSRAQAELAVRLDPHLGFAQFVLGYVRFFSDWKFREAHDRWLQAARSHPLRLHWYRYFSDAALLVGEYAEAEKELERGLALLPGSPVLLATRTRVDFYRRDFVSMERRARKLIALHPALHTGHLLLSRAALLQGRFDEAEAHIRAAKAPEHFSTLAAMARLHAYRANRRGVELLLNKPAFAKFPSITGAIWAVLGDHDRAEEQFTRALERKDLNLPYLLAEPEPRLDNNRWLRTQAAALGIRRA